MPSQAELAAGPDPLILLVLALLLDAYIGDPPGLYRVAPHPVELMGRAIGALERRLNREGRGASVRRGRGALVVIFLTCSGAAVGWAISLGARAVPFGWLAELALVMSLLAQRSLYRHVSAVARALDESGLAEGRRAVSRIVGRDPETLDQHGVARAAIESCAENLADGVIAPVFWYVLLGLPGILAYKIVNTLDSMIGHRSPRLRAFGAAAARLDDAVNFLPARLTAAIIALAAVFAAHTKPVEAMRAIVRDARKHRSPNAGWPEAAMAGALGAALAGPRRYGDAVVKDAWIGDGRARVTPQDIRRALHLFAVACALVIGLVAALALAKQALP